MLQPKNKIGLVISLSVFSAFSLADTHKLIIEGGCNYFGKNLIGQQVTLFDPDPQAVDLIEKIAKVEGLKKNFTIKAAAVDNATAIIENNARYILYNQLFLRESKEKTGSNWAAAAILAHEIAHHLNADTLDKLGSQPDTELEADRTAGTILHKMGATLTQTRQALELFASEQASATHPAKAERIAAMNNGWIESENTIGKIEPRDLVLTNPVEVKIKSTTNLLKTESVDTKSTGYIYSEAIQNFNKNNKSRIQEQKKIIFSKKEYKLLEEDIHNEAEQNYKQKNYARAFSLFRKLAEQGYANDQFYLGLMYQDAYGITKNYNQAVIWYRKAAEQGNVNGQNNLGFMYEKGFGVTKDYNQAVYWYRKAAEQNNANGQFNLGIMYENGYGVEQDNTKAKEWYRKAAEQGNTKAKDNLNILGEN